MWLCLWRHARDIETEDNLPTAGQNSLTIIFRSIVIHLFFFFFSSFKCVPIRIQKFIPPPLSLSLSTHSVPPSPPNFPTDHPPPPPHLFLFFLLVVIVAYMNLSGIPQPYLLAVCLYMYNWVIQALHTCVGLALWTSKFWMEVIMLHIYIHLCMLHPYIYKCINHTLQLLFFYVIFRIHQ